MKKARWKKTIAAGAVLMSLGVVCPVASLQAEAYLTDLGEIYMILGFAIIPLIVVYLCLSKFIIRGVALGSVKG